MASPGRMFSFRGGSHMFFIYDHRVKKEEDDPKDAILYFYPRSVKTDDQIALVGGLIGLTDFCLEFLPQDMPRCIKLSGQNFAMLQTEEYIVGLSGSVDIPEKFLLEHMQFLWSTFVFYQGSISSIKQRCAEEEFLMELHRVWDMYLPLCQSQGDVLGQSFQVLPYVQFHESQRNIFLHASHILQRSLKHHGVLAGALFNKNKVLCTQFDNTLTRTLLLLMLDSQFPGVEISSALELPGGVHLMHIFMPRSDYKKLGHRRKTAFFVDDSSESNVGKSEQRSSLSPRLGYEVRQSEPLLESPSPGSHSEQPTSAFSSPMRRPDSDLSNRSNAKFSSPSMVQNSGTDSEVFVDTVSDLKNLRNESRPRLSDVGIDKESSGGSGINFVRNTNPLRERNVESGRENQSKDESVNENGSFLASESQKKTGSSDESSGWSPASKCDYVSDKGQQTNSHIIEHEALVNEIHSRANNDTNEVTFRGDGGEKCSDKSPENVQKEGAAVTVVNGTSCKEESPECSCQKDEATQDCNANVKLLILDGNSHQDKNSSALSQRVEDLVFDQVGEKKKTNDTLAVDQRESDTSLNSPSQTRTITSEESSALNFALKAEVAASEWTSAVSTESSSKTENSEHAECASHGDSGVNQTLSAHPKSLLLKSPKLPTEGDDSDPHDNSSSSHSRELIGTLHQHNQEIEESLMVKRNNSGDESSSSELKFDGNNDELMNYDQTGSLLSLATSDVARSKDRLVFERMDSENSDPGIASPMSEVSRLSPVSETHGQSTSTVSFVKASGIENAAGQVFPDERFGESGGFEVSDSKAKDESCGSNSLWTPQDHGLEKLSLYIQGHSDTLLVLLLDKGIIHSVSCKGSVCDKDKCSVCDKAKGVVCDKSKSSGGNKEYLQHIHSLWKSCLSHLAQLDFEVKNVERYQKDEIENLGLCYHYMHYDSFTQNLTGSAIFPVTNRANEMVDACVRMHEDFINMPDLEEATYRSHTAASYGGRSISGEVFFQIPAQGPVGGNVYWQGDKTFYLNAIAKALLKKDHNISIY